MVRFVIEQLYSQLKQ